jgi:hypothetical protein
VAQTRKVARSPKPVGTSHDKFSRLHEYWQNIFWGVSERVRKKDPVLWRNIFREIEAKKLLTGQEISREQMEEGRRYKQGSLPSARGKRRDDLPLGKMALDYGILLGAVAEMLKRPSRERLQCFTQIVAGCFDEEDTKTLAQYVSGRATRQSRPARKRLACELTAALQKPAISPETQRVYLERAKKHYPDLFRTINITGGLTVIHSQ